MYCSLLSFADDRGPKCDIGTQRRKSATPLDRSSYEFNANSNGLHVASTNSRKCVANEISCTNVPNGSDGCNETLLARIRQAKLTILFFIF